MGSRKIILARSTILSIVGCVYRKGLKLHRPAGKAEGMIAGFIISSPVVGVEVGDKHHADIFRPYAELFHVGDKGRGMFPLF